MNDEPVPVADHQDQPPLPDIDPLDQPFWTPAMVVAWVAKGTPEAVRHHMDEWRRAHGLPEFSIKLDILMETNPSPLAPAWQKVESALRRGQLLASGSRSDPSGRTLAAISQLHWELGKLDVGPDGTDELYVPDDGAKFSRLLVSSEEATKLWPPQDQTAYLESSERSDVASALHSVPATPRRTRSLGRESQYIYGWFMKNYGEISDKSVADAKGQGSWRALATRITQDGKKNQGADLEIAEPDVHQFLDTMRNRGLLTKPANPAKPS